MGRRYLIVDDNAAFAENLAEILQDEGAVVTVAASGAEALAVIAASSGAASSFDALVTDMRMPIMSGARLVHEVRRIDADLPAIIVTAYTAEDDLLAARQEGLLAVLPKPAPIGHLIALLATARRRGLVALVDQDLAMADNLAEALRQRGFSAVSAHSVAEAGRLGGVRPFVALADLRVSDGHDGDALRLLIGRFPGMPVLVVTAYGHGQPVPAGLPRFSAPLDTAALLDKVEAIYERSMA